MSHYREAYSREEDKAIIEYIVNNKLFNKVKGRKLWVDLANVMFNETRVRTWLSLKERFTKRIIPNINSYNIRPQYIQLLVTPFSLKETMKGYRMPTASPKQGRERFYTKEDDATIIEKVSESHEDISGNKLWMKLERQGILEGRSWQSLRTHFLKVIVPKIYALADFQTASVILDRMKGSSEFPFDCSSSEEKKITIKRIGNSIKVEFEPSDAPSRRSSRRTKTFAEEAPCQSSDDSLDPFVDPPYECFDEKLTIPSFFFEDVRSSLGLDPPLPDVHSVTPPNTNLSVFLPDTE